MLGTLVVAKQRRKCFAYGSNTFLFWLLTVIDVPERSVERARSEKCENQVERRSGEERSGAVADQSGERAGQKNPGARSGFRYRSTPLVCSGCYMSQINKFFV